MLNIFLSFLTNTSFVFENYVSGFYFPGFHCRLSVIYTQDVVNVFVKIVYDFFFFGSRTSLPRVSFTTAVRTCTSFLNGFARLRKKNKKQFPVFFVEKFGFLRFGVLRDLFLCSSRIVLDRVLYRDFFFNRVLTLTVEPLILVFSVTFCGVIY